MSEGRPHYSFHLAGIMVCLGLLAFTLNRFYYSKADKASPSHHRPAKQGLSADTLVGQ